MKRAQQVRGLRSYKRGAHAIEAPPVVWMEWLRIDPEQFPASDLSEYRRAARNHNRLMSWGLGKSNLELIDALGRLAWTASLARARYRLASGEIDRFRGRAITSKKQLESARKGRSQGGLRKAARSIYVPAKVEAMRLWPNANRLGWTAERMWTALTDAGHEVKSDTVRKWMTKLRASGSC